MSRPDITVPELLRKRRELQVAIHSAVAGLVHAFAAETGAQVDYVAVDTLAVDRVGLGRERLVSGVRVGLELEG